MREEAEKLKAENDRLRYYLEMFKRLADWYKTPALTEKETRELDKLLHQKDVSNIGGT